MNINIHLKFALTILICILIITTFSLASKVFFNTKEINTASDSCFKNGGNPVAHTSFSTLDYTFICNNEG